ncbi:MAG TPA: hypothetical protein DCM54_12465 [Gammaproteobacteria bacterium]|nr:hypothetical protein [Gammaproteobacteria bacterium]
MSTHDILHIPKIYTRCNRLRIIQEADLNQGMDIFDVMYNCRAMRRLDTREVPKELLIKLIDAANQAPSGSNAQNARWIVVRDPVVKQKVVDLNRKGVEGYMEFQSSQLDAPPRHDAQKRQRMFDAVLWQVEHMHEIPVLIVASLEFGAKVDHHTAAASGRSIWPGIQNLLLTARAIGLGATPSTLALQDPEAVAESLRMPETMAAYCLIPVGYPTGKFGPVVRRPVEEIMHFDTWN